MEMISKLQQPLVLLIIIAAMFVSVTAQTNLALKGLTDQKSTFIDSDGTVHSADLAVHGPVNNNWTDGCSSTLASQPEAWWGLFLPKLSYITNIVFYLPDEQSVQTNGFHLFLSNTTEHVADKFLCYTNNNPTTTQEISCCFKGTWGNDCVDQCPEKCINNHCYPQNGTCVWGCDPSHCLHDKCDIHTSVCTDGCVPGRAGQYCNKYNLAFHGTATQNPLNPNKPASLTIDGNRTNGICSRTTGSGSYLQVDTGSMSVVTTVYLTFGDTPVTMYDDVIYCSNTSDSTVDGILLYKGERPTRNINAYAICRYITYVPPSTSGVDVCEIEIGGCLLGRYGANCEHFGHCNGPYDIVAGNCTSDCLDGWIGYRCEIACGSGNFGQKCSRGCSSNCLNPPCYHVSGECTGGCNKGWEGYNCTKECDDGYFGTNCSETCFGCISNKCDKTNGMCSNSSGCKSGYVKGQYCNQECGDGQFGINCEKTCYCRTKTCNNVDGVCPDGECEKGWHGYSCDKECANGFYGFNCNTKCTTCNNTSCEILEGNCSSGCIGLYEGVKCDVLECGDGQFGINCEKTCYCRTKTCNNVDGVCPDGECEKGWHGYSCDKECVPGYFGYNCAYLCETCFNQSCDIVEGNCRVGCNDGYRGRKCDMSVSTDSSAIIRFGFFVGGLASMCVVLFIIWMVKNARRRILKTKESRQATDNSHSNRNEQHYDDIMKMEGLSTYQDLAKQTVTVSNDYDQINNSYINQ